MTFGYDSTVLLSKSVAEIEDKALELLNQFSLERISPDSNRRPIVFIGHSLGGILVKKAIILAHERSDEPEYRDVLDNTKGIAFLGTPHKGSDSAWWGAVVANIVKGLSIGTLTNPRLVSDLKKDSSALISISTQFVHRTKGIRIYTFYETQKTGSIVVVDKTSAMMGLPNEKLFPVDTDHRNICRFPSAESSTYKAVGKHVALLIKGAQKPTEMALSKEYSKCLKALRPSNPDATRDKISPWVPGTCTWLLDHPRYLEWISGSEKALLWVTGAPGSGKTVLSSFIINQLESTQSLRNVGFFFVDDSATSQRSAVTLLRGLLYQILNRNASLFSHAQVHWKRAAKRAFEEPSLLWRICTACFDDPILANTVFVVDALDECATPDCEHLLRRITRYFTSRPAGSTQVKFFFTSRPEIRIADVLDTSAIRIRLEMHSDTDWLSKDIEVFIADAINTLPAMREWSSERKERIRHRLLQNADRTFLWVSLVLQKLTKEAMLSENAFNSMLSATPDGLEDIYHDILMSIPSEYWEGAKEMLSIIAMAQNPLSQEQLRDCWAVQSKHHSVYDMTNYIEPDIRRTVGFLCGQIVRWEKAKPRLRDSHRIGDNVERCRLVHQSAKDFLFSNPKVPNLRTTEQWYHLDFANATRIIANKCLLFVDLEDFTQFPMDVDPARCLNSIIVQPDILRSKLHECCKEHPFLDYAVHHWPHHFREYEQLQRSPKSVMYDQTDIHDPTDYVETLYNHNVPLRAHWFMKMLRLADMPLEQEECQIPPILFCAYNGHASVMPRLIGQMDRSDINAPMARTKFSALHAAALGKHSLMVDWLLTNGADVQATDAWNRTPLHIAARRNNGDILRCLLRHHADTSAKDDFGMTPIQGAHERGYSENVNILRQQRKDADPVLLVIPGLNQVQDGQARHVYGVDELNLEDLNIEDPSQPQHNGAQEFADEYTGRIKDDGEHLPLDFPKIVHTCGSSDSSERRSLSFCGSESSRNDSRRSLSRAPSRNGIIPRRHGSLRRSSSVHSYRGKTRSKSLDLKLERDKIKKIHPPVAFENNQIPRRSSGIDLNASVSGAPVNHRPLTTTKASRETILDFKTVILAIEGGTATSYSTLLILRELMTAIAKVEEARLADLSHPQSSIAFPTLDGFNNIINDGDQKKLSQRLPCHYFDYIAGSSFGGLLAVMLGRLRMNINDCIHEYRRLCFEIFDHDNARLRLFPNARNDRFKERYRFEERLQYIIKDIVHRRSPRRYGPKFTNVGASEDFVFDEDLCRTAVLVLECQPSVGPSALSWIQSYNSPYIASKGFKRIPNNVPTWQVALASIVSPSYSSRVWIDGTQYRDVTSTSYIDLHAAIYAEVCEGDSYARRSIAVSISPEDSKRSMVKDSNAEYLSKHAWARYISYLHTYMLQYSNGKWYRHYRFKVPQNVHGQSSRCISKMMALGQSIERKLRTSAKYIRGTLRGSNPGEQVGTWNDETSRSTDIAAKDLDRITKLTKAYLLREDVQTKIAECAQTLVELRRHRAQVNPTRWKRQCYGLRYQCVHGECVRDKVEFPDRITLFNHVLRNHPHLSLHWEDSEEFPTIVNDCMSVVR